MRLLAAFLVVLQLSHASARTVPAQGLWHLIKSSWTRSVSLKQQTGSSDHLAEGWAVWDAAVNTFNFSDGLDLQNGEPYSALRPCNVAGISRKCLV